MTVPLAVPSKVIGLTVKVRAPEPRSTLPAVITAVVPALLEEAVTLPVSVRTPPVVTRFGAVAPPLLLKMKPARVFAPTRVSEEAPFIATTFVGSICPALVVIVTVPPLIVRPPAGISACPKAIFPAAGVVPVSETVTPFTTVPPV